MSDVDELRLYDGKNKICMQHIAVGVASDGLLVKRPLLVTADGSVIPGFKAEAWSSALGK